MRVLVAGGTGALGRPAVRGMVEAGHEVRGLARGTAQAACLRGLGAEPVAADLFDLAEVEAAAAGTDAVVHLATRVPPLHRMRARGAWRENDRLRNQGTSVLVNAALAAKAGVFVQASVTLLYEGMGDVVLYESAPLDVAFPLGSARDAEREVARFTALGGQGVVLRLATTYGPEAPDTRRLVWLARRRLLGLPGPRDRWVSSVHVDDAAAAIVAALAVPAGTYNVSDDEPVSLEAWAEAFGTAFGCRPPRPLPPWLGRLLLGETYGVLARSQRVANTMLKAVTPWTPRYPSVRDGWRAVAAALAR